MVGTCDVARILCQRAHRGGKGKAFEAFAVEIGGAAETLPAPDRHDRLELHFVGHARERQRIVPPGLQNAVDRRHGAAAAQIAAERAELQLAVIEKRIAGFPQLVGPAARIHHCAPPAFSLSLFIANRKKS